MSDDLRGPMISAIAGFLGVLVGTALVPWIQRYFSRKRAARYLAIRVVCVLDKYVDDCASVAGDWGRENHEGYSEAEISSPPTPTYPSDIDWHSIDYSDMYDLLALPAVAEKAANVVGGAGEYADAPDYDGFFETRSFEYATLGLKAFELTVKLWNKYRIRELGRTEWDPVEHMKNQLQKVKEIQNKRRAYYEAQVLPSMPASPATAPIRV